MNVGDRMRLLVVEDDNNIRRGLIKVIKKMHLPIEVFLEAESGDEAITIYLEHRPNIVITDIKMGEITGLDFIEYVRSIGDKVHFIIISGYTDFDYAQRAIRNKVVDYIKKPIDTEYLKKILISTIYNVKENSNT
ncbi:response regulator, partial [Vallitalea guaymasensis]|uniref:response regulator n=1 Tax=Vallitalea guaymasensis TaxID=1185412 RepID=UPI00272CFD83